MHIIPISLWPPKVHSELRNEVEKQPMYRPRVVLPLCCTPCSQVYRWHGRDACRPRTECRDTEAEAELHGTDNIHDAAPNGAGRPAGRKRVLCTTCWPRRCGVFTLFCRCKAICVVLWYRWRFVATFLKATFLKATFPYQQLLRLLHVAVQPGLPIAATLALPVCGAQTWLPNWPCLPSCLSRLDCGAPV